MIGLIGSVLVGLGVIWLVQTLYNYCRWRQMVNRLPGRACWYLLGNLDGLIKFDSPVPLTQRKLDVSQCKITTRLRQAKNPRVVKKSMGLIYIGQESTIESSNIVMTLESMASLDFG